MGAHRKSDRRPRCRLRSGRPVCHPNCKKRSFPSTFWSTRIQKQSSTGNIALLVETLASSRLPASALRWPEILGLNALKPILFAQPGEASQFLHHNRRFQFTGQPLPASRTTKLMRLFRARADTADGRSGRCGIGWVSFHRWILRRFLLRKALLRGGRSEKEILVALQRLLALAVANIPSLIPAGRDALAAGGGP